MTYFQSRTQVSYFVVPETYGAYVMWDAGTGAWVPTVKAIVLAIAVCRDMMRKRVIGVGNVSLNHAALKHEFHNVLHVSLVGNKVKG